MARELTQQQMADALHMTLRNYQKYESGDTSPTMEGLIIIADTLNVFVDFLLERDEYLKTHGVVVNISLENPPRHPRSKKNQ